MKVIQLVTALACLLALAGCPSSKLPLADSNLDGGDDGRAGASAPGFGACPEPSGAYEAQLEQRTGTCGEVAPANPVPVKDETITIQKFADRDVETETNVKGCTLFLRQLVRDKTGQAVSMVEGSALEIDSDGSISGVVTLTQFDSASQSAQCSGDYQIELHELAEARPGRDSGTVDPSVPGHASADGGMIDPSVPGHASADAGIAAPAARQLQTQSLGCQRIPNTELCFGEGWMLTDGEPIPACNESGAYRICTFANGACGSHTVMMVQPCD
jgi:hypothetical protein